MRYAAVVFALAAVHCGGEPVAPSDGKTADEPIIEKGAPVRDAPTEPSVPAGGAKTTLSGAIVSEVTAPDGSVYSTGTFSGIATVGGTQLTSRGERDVFVMKLDAYGTVHWVISIGSAHEESSPKITFDGERATVVGMTDGEMDCGGGPLPAWSGETFFVCQFHERTGESLASGAFPTGRSKLSTR